jgi:TetR/AcrR family transcriptional regulator, transcriptional repressor for nem operon
MPRSGARTREKIVDVTQALVYQHGFAATSIDKVIDGAEITKGAFFYHFKSKADLGRALIQRYAERDLAHLERTMARAEKLSSDPRQQVLIFIGLLQEDYEELPDPVPGCLLTSYLYERAEYPDDVGEIAMRTFEQWRHRVASKTEEAAAINGLPVHVTPDGLAGILLALIEGGFVLAKAERDVKVLTNLLGQFRSQLEQLFNVRNDAVEPNAS